MTMLDDAQGSIPLTDHSRDAAFLSDLEAGRWLIAAQSSVPAACIDGRPSAAASPNTPRSAGGTVGLWVALNLSSPEPTPMFEVIDRLLAADQPVGGHTGPSHGTDSSGCGAADHLGEILDLVGTDAVRRMISEWGFGVGPLDTLMVDRARELAEAGFSGPALLAPLQASAAADMPALVGGHRESAALVNHRNGTTTSAEMLATADGDAPQAFQIDAWAFQPAARVFFPNDPALQERFQTALAAFNAAALLVLVEPGFPVVDNG